ncbi:hypothetical protein [Nonomuraea longicatena]|uniref:Uncharacterized protein n=1 Tax=Nonomuraea longicatena TaxID=83682 RepID=A0ABN1NP66_9ACTN
MSQRLKAVTVALAMGAGAVALAPAASASTNPTISSVDISPGSPIVVRHHPVTATFTFTTKGAGKAELQLRAPGDVGVGGQVDLRPSPHGEWTRWTGTKSFDSKDAGRWNFLVVATGEGESSKSGSFEVRSQKVLDTRIAGFDASPEPVERGDRLNFTGSLEGEGWDGLSGEKVAILFRGEHSSRWEYVTSDVTGRHGRFHASATAYRSGSWKAVFEGSNGLRGSSSDPDWVRVDDHEPPTPEPPGKDDSRVIKFNASPEPIKRGRTLTFRAKLQVDDSGSWEGHRGKVRLLFKAKGASHWKYVKSTWSNYSGNIWTKAKATKSGQWKFVYNGDAGHYGDHSNRDYVHVKRR